MKILLGETRSSRNLQTLQERGWGRMFVARKPTPFAYEPWGFDNGAFGSYLHGEGFPTETFEKRLDQAFAVASDPYMAVTPDIVANGCESLEFSLEWRMKLPNGWPWYLAVQDGMELAEVENSLHLFSGIFLGGSDRFKATAYRWAQLAHKHCKKFHYGRASTPAKLGHAYRVKSDSCDTSFPLWTNDRMRTFGYAVTNLGSQQSLGLEAGA
jgi:hypothetical protein